MYIFQYYSFDLFCFSLDDSGRNIYEGITKSRIFDAESCKDKGLVLYAVHDKFYPIVAKAVKDKGIRLDVVDHCYMFSIPREEALKFDVGYVWYLLYSIRYLYVNGHSLFLIANVNF